MVFGKRRRYLDNASFLPLLKESRNAIDEVFSLQVKGRLGNPLASNKEGRDAKVYVDEAKSILAKGYGTQAQGVLFTGSATEANRVMLVSAFNYAKDNGVETPHIISSAFEHTSIVRYLKTIERMGGEVTSVLPDKKGQISPEAVLKEIKPNTILVSIMGVNSELGSVQPVKKIAQAVKGINPEIIVHSDFAQATYLHSFTVEKDFVDCVSVDGVKIGGPQGIGALVMRPGTPLCAECGDNSVFALRPGTPHVALIHGFAVAFQIAEDMREKNFKYITKLRDTFMEGFSKIQGAHIHTVGGVEDLKEKNFSHMSPHIMNIYFEDVDHEYLATLIDEAGFGASTGTACSRLANGGLASFEAIKQVSSEPAKGIRISLGTHLSVSDMKDLVKEIEKSLPLAKEGL